MRPGELEHLRQIEARKALARRAHRAQLLAGREGGGKRKAVGALAIHNAAPAESTSGTSAEAVEDTADTVVLALLDGAGKAMAAFQLAGLAGLDRQEVDRAIGRLLVAGAVRTIRSGNRTTFELVAARGGA